MMRGMLTISGFISTILFPWPLTVLLVLGVSLLEPLVPIAVGLFADTLYYAPQSGALPVFTFYGILATIVALFVRSRLKASIING